MDFNQAVQEARKLGALTLNKNGTGALDMGGGNRKSWYSDPQFIAVVTDVGRKERLKALKAKFAQPTRVEITEDSRHKGKKGVTGMVDGSDLTVLVVFDDGGRAWFFETDLKVMPMYAVKDSVEIVDDGEDNHDEEWNGKQGIVVEVANDPSDEEPFLVYIVGERETYWFSAAELKRA